VLHLKKIKNAENLKTVPSSAGPIVAKILPDSFCWGETDPPSCIPMYISSSSVLLFFPSPPSPQQFVYQLPSFTIREHVSMDQYFIAREYSLDFGCIFQAVAEIRFSSLHRRNKLSVLPLHAKTTYTLRNA
jgi:hypothetical protein